MLREGSHLWGKGRTTLSERHITPSPAQLDEIKMKIETIGKPYVSGSSGKPGYSYLPIPFDELRDIPHHRPDSYDRFAAMNKIIPFEDREILDLGCNTGFFCFGARDVGASEVIGVEYDKKNYQVCEMLKDAYGYDSAVTFYEGRIEHYLDKVTDVVIAESVLHWIRISAGDQAMKDYIKELAERCRHAFIEIPRKGSGGAGVPFLETVEDVRDYLLECSFSSVTHAITVSSHAGPRETFLCRGQK